MKTQFRIGLTLLALAAVAWSPPPSGRTDTEVTTEQIGSLVLHRAAPEYAEPGRRIWVVLAIENTGAENAEIVFTEMLGNAAFDTSRAKVMDLTDPGPGGNPITGTGPGMQVWYYEWTVSLPAGKTATLAYWLEPAAAGLYEIPPAKILLNGEEHYARSRTITVRCRADGQCRPAEGETYLSCAEDCPSGSSDGICDAAADGRIDPDCAAGFDPDAAAPTHAVTQPAAAPDAVQLIAANWQLVIACAVIILALAALIVLSFAFLRTIRRRSR